MNKKIALSIVIIISLISLLYVYIGEIKIDQEIAKNTNKSMIEKDFDEVNIRKNKVKPSSQQLYQVQSIVEVTDEVTLFNKGIAYDLSYDKNSKSKAIERLMSKPKDNSSDVIDAIANYYDDIPKHQIEIDRLIGKCKRANESILGFEKVISQSDETLSEDAFNQYYFFQGLIESKICKDHKTPRDPFFVMLKSARKGDMLSRLLLINHLLVAIQRKVINTWRYPFEYMQIRDEAVVYLQQLAAKGVTRASVRLAQLYAFNSIALPSNIVLEYYYSYLAIKQEGIEKVYVKDPASIYKRLTDKQKNIVDRMTENL